MNFHMMTVFVLYNKLCNDTVLQPVIGFWYNLDLPDVDFALVFLCQLSVALQLSLAKLNKYKPKAISISFCFYFYCLVTMIS